VVKTASTSADLRELNLARALTLVHEASHELTRVELADRLSVTRTTAAVLVNDLAALDLILEREADPTGRRGRPTTIIRRNPHGPVVLAIEVALDAISIAEVAIGGELGNRTVVPLESTDPDIALKQLDQLVHLRRSELNSVCAGIGVAMHGLVDHETGIVVQAPHLGWVGVSLGDHLSRSHGLPVSVGNDATLGAIVEAKRGAGRRSKTMLYLRSTVGVGGAFIFDAKPAPSRRGWHGEMGHLPFGDQRNKCRCGAYGCWEIAINQSALATAAGLTPSTTTADELARSVMLAAQGGDAEAGRAVAGICTILGRGLGALVNALDPHIIVLSGHVRALYETDPESTIEALRTATMRAHRASLPPVRSGIIEHPALAGAGEIMLTQLIESPSRFLAPA
jgi:predicted NBD/HSP70 family sugar kinase